MTAGVLIGGWFGACSQHLKTGVSHRLTRACLSTGHNLSRGRQVRYSGPGPPTAVADVGRAARTKEVGGRAPLKPFRFRPVLASKRTALGCVTASGPTSGTRSWGGPQAPPKRWHYGGNIVPPVGQHPFTTHHRFRGGVPAYHPPCQVQARLGGVGRGFLHPPFCTTTLRRRHRGVGGAGPTPLVYPMTGAGSEGPGPGVRVVGLGLTTPRQVLRREGPGLPHPVRGFCTPLRRQAPRGLIPRDGS